MKRKLSVILALSMLLAIFVLPGVSQAEEMSPYKQARWHIIVSGKAHTKVDTNLLNFSTGLLDKIYDACREYTDSYAKVSSEKVNSAVTTADTFVISPSQARWKEIGGKDDNYAVTELETEQGFVSSNYNNFVNNAPTSYRNYVFLKRARIYANPDDKTQPLSASKQKAILTHELGHVYGMWHPSNQTASIMIEYLGNYTSLQAYDHRTLNEFYIPEVLS